ncbi:MAG: PAS domain S-box protein [Xanthomonadales bacterium]|nr:PAS domain S-box protein [Xanthomonadales bacterium]
MNPTPSWAQLLADPEVFASHPDPMWVFERATLRILEVNEQALQSFGYDREQLLAMRISELRPSEDVAALHAALRKVETGYYEGGVWRLRRRDGEIMSVDVRWHTVDFRGVPAVLATLRDVSRLLELEAGREELLARERRWREQAEAAAAQFRALFESAPGKYLVVAADSLAIIAASNAFLVATRTRRESLQGRSLFDVFPDAPGADGSKRLRSVLQDVCRDGMTEVIGEIRYPIPRPAEPSGFEERWWSGVLTPVKRSDGSVVHIILRVEDITEFVRSGDPGAGGQPVPEHAAPPALDMLLHARELQAANVRLREQDANLRIAQRLLGIGVWKLALDSMTLVWTDNIYAIYGTTPQRFGHSFDEYVARVHPDERDAELARFLAFLDLGDRYFEFRHRAIRDDGGIVHVRGIAEITGRGDQRVLTGVVQDVTALVEADAKLSQATQLLRTAGRIARLGGWRVDLVSERVSWSPEIAALLDEPADIVPTVQKALDYYLPDSRARLEAAFRRCCTDGTSYDEVLQLDTARGRRLWVHATGTAEHDRDGHIVAVNGAFQDISELVEARDRSDLLARRLEETLRGIRDGFLTFDRDWRFTFVNDEGARMLGRARDTLLDRTLWEAIPETADGRFRNELEYALDHREMLRFEQFYAPTQRWLEISVHPLHDGAAVYLRDVSVEHERAERLRVSEERFRRVAEVTDDVVWDWDMVSGRIWWNDVLKRKFGHDPSAGGLDLGWWSARIHDDDRVRVADGLQQVIDSGGTHWHAEYRFLHADGSERIVIDRGSVIRDEAGQPLRMLGSMIDVTEQRQLAEGLRQAQKLEAVGQLTGGVAHDFNNLLTVILGNAELLSEQLGSEHRLRMLAEMTATAAERGAELTRRLLAFARRQPLQPKPLDLNRLLAGMDALLRRTLPAHIGIELVRAGGLWTAEVDPGQLENAVLNLAINARDAMDGNGCLTIETANVVLDEAYAAAQVEVHAGQYVMVSVSDTGTGMRPEVAARAFDPFFTTKEVGRGSGLGLAMVYGFAKQSGGHAKIYSEPGNGTSVKLYFPRAHANVEALENGSVDARAPRGNELLLVVEDDVLVGAHLLAQLAELGYRTLSASNGVEALALLRAHPEIDLLFTDIVMPGGMNGRQLADAAWSLYPQLKVLFTSGYTENAIVHQGRLDPGLHLLGKPYRRLELARKLRQVLDQPNVA